MADMPLSLKPLVTDATQPKYPISSCSIDQIFDIQPELAEVPVASFLTFAAGRREHILHAQAFCGLRPWLRSGSFHLR